MTQKRLVLAALAVLGLWHLGLRWRAMSLPMISDEGEYAYEARLLSDGGLPYRDAYNQKPPAVFFLYRLAFSLFGRHAQAPRLLALFFCWATMLLLFASTPAGWTFSARLCAPAAFGALSTLPIGDLGFTANTEVFLCLFSAFAAWCLIRSWDDRRTLAWLAGAGLASGAAFMTKQTALWTGAGFCALAAVGRGSPRKRLSSAGAFAGSAAIVPLACWLYFLARGGAGDFLDQAFRRNMDYSSLVLSSLTIGPHFAWLIKTLGPLLLKGGWPVCLLAAFGLVFSKMRAGANAETLITLWLGTAIVGVCTGLFFFPHYFVQVLPPLALAAAMGARWAENRWRTLSSGPWLALAVSLLPALAYSNLYFGVPRSIASIPETPELLARKLLYPNPLFETRAVGEEIRRRSAPSDRVYVFGSEPQLYFYAGRLAATRHVFVFPLTLFPRDRALIDVELKKLAEAAPKFIVYVNVPASTMVGSRLGQVFRNGVLELLGRKYRWTGTIDMRGPETKTAFWSGEEGPPGATPDWAAEPKIYLFERR